MPTQAYTLTQTQNGENIRWHYGQKFFLAGNTNNDSGLSPEVIWNAVVNGLQQWKRATEKMFDFDYWQGTNPSIYKSKQEKDGLNSIFFASQSNKKTDPNIIGYTQVWFNSDSGDMIEADIILNDRDYILTDQPTDTSSRATTGKKKVYLNNVVTHELGHALGLSHSNSINSTMLYVEFSEQYKLGCDDWSAVKHLYPTAHDGMGSLSGTILSQFGEPVPGAVVTAISIARGIPMASVLTDQNGIFNFGALESGSFSLMVENYQGTPASVPTRMRIKSGVSVCENNKFPKNFITESDQHTLKKFQINAGSNANIGAFSLNCSEITEIKTDPAINSPDIFVDRGEVGTSKTYTFNANGPFKITGLGYLLISPIKVALSIAGDQSKIDDSSVSGTAFGPITVKVEISANESSSFPSPAVWPGSDPYFVIVFNGNAKERPHSSIPNNARCESSEPFPPYQSPAGNPIRDATSTTTRDDIGFCGNAHAATFHDHSHEQSKRQPNLGAILGWSLPFLVAIACQLFLRRRRAKLES